MTLRELLQQSSRVAMEDKGNRIYFISEGKARAISLEKLGLQHLKGDLVAVASLLSRKVYICEPRGKKVIITARCARPRPGRQRRRILNLEA